MKTNEFREYLKSEWNFKEYDDYFEIHNIGKIFKSSNVIINLCLTNVKGELFSKIYEYAKTPLEEREEEKKYYLMFPKGIEIEETCLYKSSKENKYEVCVGGVKCKSHQPYIQFTQKEIDAMPFDTNFFIKEEVK